MSGNVRKIDHSALFFAAQSGLLIFRPRGNLDCAAENEAGWPIFWTFPDNSQGQGGQERFFRLIIYHTKEINKKNSICYSAILPPPLNLSNEPVQIFHISRARQIFMDQDYKLHGVGVIKNLQTFEYRPFDDPGNRLNCSSPFRQQTKTPQFYRVNGDFFSNFRTENLHPNTSWRFNREALGT